MHGSSMGSRPIICHIGVNRFHPKHPLAPTRHSHYCNASQSRGNAAQSLLQRVTVEKRSGTAEKRRGTVTTATRHSRKATRHSYCCNAAQPTWQARSAAWKLGSTRVADPIRRATVAKECVARAPQECCARDTGALLGATAAHLGETAAAQQRRGRDDAALLRVERRDALASVLHSAARGAFRKDKAVLAELDRFKRPCGRNRKSKEEAEAA